MDETQPPDLPNPFLNLSPRERDVMLLLADGFSCREIGDRLGLASATVHKHRAALLNKVGAANEVIMVREAIKRGIVTP